MSIQHEMQTLINGIFCGPNATGAVHICMCEQTNLLIRQMQTCLMTAHLTTMAACCCCCHFQNKVLTDGPTHEGALCCRRQLTLASELASEPELSAERILQARLTSSFLVWMTNNNVQLGSWVPNLVVGLSILNSCPGLLHLSVNSGWLKALQ